MSEKSRRRFMKQSAALVSGLALAGCEPSAEAPAATSSGSGSLDPETLAGLGDVILPRTALGSEGLARVVEGFRAWLTALEPGAELDHPYIWTDDISYGPPDPAPAWAEQLEALEHEAERRHGRRYAALSRAEREALLREQLPRDGEGALPDPARASHVALGLLAYFYETPEANDLCYQARIERHACRGLDTAADEPARS